MAPTPRFVVGIDLGTTNTVVAYSDTRAPRAIHILGIEQQVSPGELARRPLLPSARYHAGEGELPAASIELARHDVEGETIDAPVIVGAGALALGAKNPTRLVTSAKSWLSHSGVDRHAPILPWGSANDVPRTSPVDATASYLRRVRAAFRAAHPEHELAEQDIVLTVPASFDETARALTLEASRRAGLPKVRLVEEPTAAFHHFLERHRDTLDETLRGVRLALVVDVGGGTTDLTLVRVELRDTGVRLTRIAVGDHLMLGGDNLDHALAHTLETRLSPGGPLGPGRFLELVARVRTAKEILLAEGAPERQPVTILGSGSRLVGGALQTELTREQALTLATDGFFPWVDGATRPDKRKAGLVELGLPYVADPAITKHIVAFLSRHDEIVREALGDDAPPVGELAVPDAVLVNGGMFHAPAVRERLVAALSAVRGKPVRLLEGYDPDLAVAYGAVAYGLARRGDGVKIGGGSSRSFYLITSEADASRTGVCVLPRGSEENESVRLERRIFSLKLGRPVRFHLASTTSDVRHVRPGDIDTIDASDDRFETLPPISAVLGETGETGEIAVELVASLTEIGTLELACVEVKRDGDSKSGALGRRYKLEFQLRGDTSRESDGAVRVTKLHPRFAEAVDAVRAIYGKPIAGAEPRDVKRLRVDLDKILGPREAWDTALLRELFGALLAGMKHRRRSADHERVWFNLIGYSLRPGFGYPLDAWRAKQIRSVVEQGLQFAPEAQNWAEFWTMLRRVSGGLEPELQERIADQIDWYIEPPAARPRPRPAGPKKLGFEEMVALAGSLEHLEVQRKIRFGDSIVERIASHGDNPQGLWAVGRIGARVPAYGSAHRVVPADVATRWLEVCLESDWSRVERAAFAAVQLARMSGDRLRDLPLPTRTRVRARLEAHGANPIWVQMVSEVTRMEAAEERRVFGDTLPPGLRLLDE